MVRFFVKFLEKHPEYKDRPIFVTGESYAGHYVPSITAYLLSQNIQHLNIKAMAIGNPLVSMRDQFPEYAQFATDHKLVPESLNFLMRVAGDECRRLLYNREPIEKV